MSARARAAIGITLAAMLSARAGGRQGPASAVLAVRDAQIAPDGRTIAFTRGSAIGSGVSSRVNLWRVSFAGGDPQPLTSGEAEDAHPRWAPNGELLAFLSRPLASGAPASIFTTPPAGGAARQITSGLESVTTFEWSPDGRQMAYLAGPGPGQLRIVDVATGNSQPVASLAAVSVAAFSWGPDAAALAAILAGDDGQLVIAPSTGTGARRAITVARPAAPEVGWSRQPALIAWLGAGVGPAVGIMTVPPAGTPVRNASIAGPGSPIHLRWTGDGRLSVVYRDGTATWIDLIDPSAGTRGTVMPQWVAELTSAPSWSADGTRYAVAGRTAEHPPEVFGGSLPPPQINTPNAGAIPPPVRRITISNP